MRDLDGFVRAGHARSLGFVTHQMNTPMSTYGAVPPNTTARACNTSLIVSLSFAVEGFHFPPQCQHGVDARVNLAQVQNGLLPAFRELSGEGFHFAEHRTQGR